MRYPSRFYSDKANRPSIGTRRVAVLCFIIGAFLGSAAFLTLALFTYDTPYTFLMMAFVASIAFELTATVLLKFNPIIVVVLAGLGLAVLSFFYQPLGPEFRSVGTECQPISDCFRPVRGGGFPVQYVIDVPGITFWDLLGFEDDFRLWSFIADICFYVCLVSLIHWIIQYLRLRKASLMASAG